MRPIDQIAYSKADRIAIIIGTVAMVAFTAFVAIALSN